MHSITNSKIVEIEFIYYSNAAKLLKAHISDESISATNIYF